ncbi:MAG: hypothetical protein LBV01_02380 [Deltaproteobacteria bacterium]|jgi:predicted hotdog family 3-hydroxylacyl-ACP dehydratase|nr:hypothetical protein [Deltaproteobacteria bacterium]
MERSLPADVASLLPHQGRMRCIDMLLEENGDRAVAGVTLREGHALLTDGILDRAGFIELAAQAAGARQGYVRLGMGLGPGPGFLVGAQDFCFLKDARVGDDLTIAIRLTGELHGLSVVVVSVHRGSEELASGKLKLYEPSPAAPEGNGPRGTA